MMVKTRKSRTVASFNREMGVMPMVLLGCCSERNTHERFRDAVPDDRLWRFDRGNHEKRHKKNRLRLQAVTVIEE